MDDKKRVVLAGGSGFLGRALAADLRNLGYDVAVLTRSPSSSADLAWDGRTLGPWAQALEGAEAVVNLTGKSVVCRYTPANREEINRSRVDSVRVVDLAIAGARKPPRVLIQVASLAIYGDAGDRICDEQTAPGHGFPVETCLLWEKAFNEARTPETRRVILRGGIVLGPGGGPIRMLLTLTRGFLGGRAGPGTQWFSWVSQADMLTIFRRAIENPSMQGVYNATSPTPVTNAQLMAALRRALHRPWSPPVPSWGVLLGGWLTGIEGSLALTGRRGTPKRLLEEGFQFGDPEIESALKALARN